MYPAICQATTILMTTAPGATSRSMGTCGFRPMCRPTGRPTAMATGTGLLLGAGPGSITLLGVLLPSTMDAGRSLAGPGAGARDGSLVPRFMDRRSSVSSVAAGGLDWALAWAGSRWAGV